MHWKRTFLRLPVVTFKFNCWCAPYQDNSASVNDLVEHNTLLFLKHITNFLFVETNTWKQTMRPGSQLSMELGVIRTNTLLTFKLVTQRGYNFLLIFVNL